MWKFVGHCFEFGSQIDVPFLAKTCEFRMIGDSGALEGPPECGNDLAFPDVTF